MKRLFKKHIRIWLALIALVFAVAGCGGSGEDEGEHVDFSDPLSGESIATAADLLAFIQSGHSGEATLAASIDIGDDFLDITAKRGAIAIHGNGNTISGNGDCVIRLEDGCELTLNDVTLLGGAGAIGCLGQASVSGNADISAVSHAIDCKDGLSIGAESRLSVKSNMGSAIRANRLTLGAGARVLTNGGVSAVDILMDDILLEEGAVLDAATQTHYNALKCAGTLSMKEGSRLIVTNAGDYHGAEVGGLAIDGMVTVEATGGSKGVGVFLFDLEETYYLFGFCAPEARHEVGDGSLIFIDDLSEIPTPEPDAPQEDEPDASPDSP